jgi:hypothetical protein
MQRLCNLLAKTLLVVCHGDNEGMIVGDLSRLAPRWLSAALKSSDFRFLGETTANI